MEVNSRDDQTRTRKLVRNPVVQRAGGAAPQPDVSQAQPMDVSLDQKNHNNCNIAKNRNTLEYKKC